MLTLPALQDVCVPNAAFMRVWQLEGGRLARILRGKQVALRYEGLTEFTPLHVYLMTNILFLNIYILFLNDILLPHQEV